LPGVATVPSYFLLGVPARGPQAQARASVPCGRVYQGVGGQADCWPAAQPPGAGAQRVQAGQDQPSKRPAVIGQQRVRESVAAPTQDLVVNRVAQLQTTAGAVKVRAAARVH